MKATIKVEITLSAKEVQAVEFWSAFHGPRRNGAAIENDLNESEKELYQLGEKVDANVRGLCGGSSLPSWWRKENKNGGVYSYSHPLRRNYKLAANL